MIPFPTFPKSSLRRSLSWTWYLPLLCTSLYFSYIPMYKIIGQFYMLVAPYNWHAINILLHLAPFLLNIWLPHQSMMIHIVLPHSFFFSFWEQQQRFTLNLADSVWNNASFTDNGSIFHVPYSRVCTISTERTTGFVSHILFSVHWHLLPIRAYKTTLVFFTWRNELQMLSE